MCWHTCGWFEPTPCAHSGGGACCGARRRLRANDATRTRMRLTSVASAWPAMCDVLEKKHHVCDGPHPYFPYIQRGEHAGVNTAPISSPLIA